MSDWQDISSAPDWQVVEVRAGGMEFLARYDPIGAMDDEERTCGQWQALNEGEHPPCWSDGCCWETNMDGQRSAQPSAWKPTPATVAADRGGRDGE